MSAVGVPGTAWEDDGGGRGRSLLAGGADALAMALAEANAVGSLVGFEHAEQPSEITRASPNRRSTMDPFLRRVRSTGRHTCANARGGCTRDGEVARNVDFRVVREI
jgi:hypothetical protein